MPSQILFPKFWKPLIFKALGDFADFKKAVDLYLFFMPSTHMVTGLIAIFYVGSLSQPPIADTRNRSGSTQIQQRHAWMSTPLMFYKD